MRILVEGLPSAGREVGFGLRDEWAVTAATTALDRSPRDLEGTIALTRNGTRGVVVVDVVARAAAAATCDRCGEECGLGVELRTRMLYAPEEVGGEAYDGAELELQEQDLDLGWYAEGALVLEDVLREALALEVPARITCADTTGCDKRTDALLAANPVADGPFAVLGRLKVGPNREN